MWSVPACPPFLGGIQGCHPAFRTRPAVFYAVSHSMVPLLAFQSTPLKSYEQAPIWISETLQASETTEKAKGAASDAADKTKKTASDATEKAKSATSTQ